MKSFSKNYRQIFALVFAITGLFLSSLITVLIYFETSTENEKIERKQANYYLQDKQHDLNNFIKNHFEIIASFANNDFYYNYIENYKYTYFQMFLRSIQSYTKSIKNITYTNASGEELIKLKRFQPGSTFILNHSNDLRNIKNSELFKNIHKLENGDIYVSPIKKNEFKNDINDNNFEISIGYKIYDDYELVGVFVLDLYLDELLNEMVNTSNFNAYIMDEKKCLFATNVKNIKNQVAKECIETSIDEINYTTIYKTSSQEIKLYISSIKKSESFFAEISNTYILVFIVVIILSLLLSSYLADIPKKLNEKITDQKKMFVQQSKFAAMGEMISVISHQWRQPLNEVTVVMDEIKLKYQYQVLTQEELDYLTNEIYDSVDYMSNTIEDFNNFFKPNKEKETFNVNNVLEETLSLIKSRINNLEIKINFEVENKNLKYLGYKNELKQVFLNILNNAVDVLEDREIENKQIFLKIDADNEFLKISIRDNAGGIPIEIIDDVFNPYFSTKSEKNGTGIGLYIAKVIIENNMHGEIDVENINHGAQFIIKLPLDLKEIV